MKSVDFIYEMKKVPEKIIVQYRSYSSKFSRVKLREKER